MIHCINQILSQTSHAAAPATQKAKEMRAFAKQHSKAQVLSSISASDRWAKARQHSVTYGNRATKITERVRATGSNISTQDWEPWILSTPAS